MGFLDRLLGREEEQPVQQAPAANSRSAKRTDDEIAVERYQYLLRTAPPETIEQVHTEAFSKLTPQQRDILFAKLSENATQSERPASAEPQALAQAATRAEIQQPGTLTRTLGATGMGGPSFGSMFASSLLGSVAGYVIGSALVSAFLPNDYGSDSSADGDNSDNSGTDNSDNSDNSGSDNSGDGSDSTSTDTGTDSSADVTTASADTGYDSGYDTGYDGGGDFGGGDFGGGDFGGGDFF